MPENTDQKNSKYRHISQCVNLKTIEKLDVRLKVHRGLEKCSTVNDHCKKYHNFASEETAIFIKFLQQEIR